MMKKLSRKGGGSIDPNMLAGQLEVHGVIFLKINFNY